MFVIAGYTKIGGFAGTVAYVASKGLPAAQVVAALTIALELGGGLALIAGFQARWAALALAVFTLVAALIFHNFWAVAPEQQMTQYLMFMKNLAISGGLLVDHRLRPRRLELGRAARRRAGAARCAAVAAPPDRGARGAALQSRP